MIHDWALQWNMDLLLLRHVEMMKENFQQMMNSRPGTNDWCYMRIFIHPWITEGAISEWDARDKELELQFTRQNQSVRREEIYWCPDNMIAVIGLCDTK